MNWNEQYIAGKTFFQKGNYEEAAQSLKDAVAELGKIEADSVELSNCLIDLAKVYIEQAQYNLARQACEQALSIRVKQFGDESLPAAQVLNVIGVIDLKDRCYDAAEQSLKKSLEITRKEVGPHHSQVGQVLNNLGALYLEQEKYDQAEPLLTQGLGIRDKAVGNKHPDYAESLTALATNHFRCSNFTLSEPLFRQALMIREEFYGDDHPLTAVSLNNLASQYLKKGNLDKAEPLWRRALSIQEAKLPIEHPLRIHMLDQLAATCLRLGHTHEAEQLYRKALEIIDKNSSSPQLGITLAGLGLTYLKQNKLSEAEHFIKRSLALLGETHERIDTMEKNLIDNLFHCYVFQGKFVDALRLVPDSLRAKHTAEFSSLIDILKHVYQIIAKHPWKKDAQ